MARRTGISRVGVRTGRKVTLYLDDETIERARVLGNGNASDGIREAVVQAIWPIPVVLYDKETGKPHTVILATGELYTIGNEQVTP